MSLLRNFAHENRLSRKSQMRDRIRYKGAKNTVGIWITKMQQMANNKRRPSKKRKKVCNETSQKSCYIYTDWLTNILTGTETALWIWRAGMQSEKETGQKSCTIYTWTDWHIYWPVHVYVNRGRCNKEGNWENWSWRTWRFGLVFFFEGKKLSPTKR